MLDRISVGGWLALTLAAFVTVSVLDTIFLDGFIADHITGIIETGTSAAVLYSIWRNS